MRVVCILLLLCVVIGVFLSGVNSNRVELRDGGVTDQLYSHGSPIVEEFELQHEAGSEGEYEAATSPRTISRRLSHRMNADRVLHMRSRTSAKKTMMKAKKPAAAAKKPPAATKKASSTKSKSAASSSASTAASPSSLTGTKSKDEVFSHFIVAFRKGYKDLATAKAKQATVKANTAKIDALNKRIKNNEPPVAQLVKSDVATATNAAGSSSSSSSTKKTNTKAKAKAKATTRGKARFADVEMDAPENTKPSKSFKQSSSKKKAVEATSAERIVAKTKLKPIARRAAKRKTGRAVFGVNRFSDLTADEFKAKYANSQSASQIVLAVKTKCEKKLKKLKNKKIPWRGINSNKRAGRSNRSSRSNKPLGSSYSTRPKSKKRSTQHSFIELYGPPPPRTNRTSSNSTTSITAAAFGHSNVVGGPEIRQKPTATSQTGENPSSLDSSVSAVAVSPAGTWSEDEIADFQAQARSTPNVPYKKYNDFVDQPCDWSGVIPVVRATSGCGACWAVTTADAIQAAYFGTYGKALKQVSSQGIMDCNFNAYNGGCKGGSLANAINSIIDNSVARKVNGGEVYFESDYPYRYNTDADAMHQECKPQSGSPQSIVSTWAWAIPPLKSALVDIAGYMKALEQHDQLKQQGERLAPLRQELAQRQAESTEIYNGAQVEVSKRQQQIDSMRQTMNDQIAQGDKKLRDMSTLCDSKARAARALPATDRNGALEDASRCGSELAAADRIWQKQRKQLHLDFDQQVATLPSVESIVATHVESGNALLKGTLSKMDAVTKDFPVMSTADLMDVFSGYLSLSYGWYSTDVYQQWLKLAGTPEEKREILLARALNKYGPLAVIINAANLVSYAGGILQPSDSLCSSAPEKGDHAIMLVGLAKDPATDEQYWILKNSWTTEWGNDGYLYLARGYNLCGLANAPSRVSMKGDVNDPVAVRHDAQVAVYLAGQPSTYMPRE